MCRCVGVPVCQCIGVSMFEGGSIFMTHRDFRGLLKNVIPAKAGIHKSLKLLDPRFREDDKKCIFQQSPTDPAKQSEPTVKTVKKVASAPHKKVAAKKVPTIKAKKTVKKKTV